MVINLADKIIQAFQLNKDQATAMMQIGAMMTSQEMNTETGKNPTFPITIIHGKLFHKSFIFFLVLQSYIQEFPNVSSFGRTMVHARAVKCACNSICTSSVHAGTPSN